MSEQVNFVVEHYDNDTLAEANEQLTLTVVRLYNENAKLREFATLAWQILTRNEPMHVWQGMVDDARELGIEVN